MGRKTVLLPLLGVLGAYYIYTPLPGNIEERWKLICWNANFRTIQNLAVFLELLGINHFMDTCEFLLSLLEVPPTSDENITVMDTTFNNIPVRVYVPNRKSQALRRGVFYVHGGGWCFGSAALANYDCLSRQTVNRLDAVVISTNYRLAPEHHFPKPFEDVYTSLKWFLRPDVLEKYGIDPKRTGISGDSSGGNLAAAVAQKLMDDPDVKIKLKTQCLIYPLLQTIDMDLPSSRDNTLCPVMPKSLGVRFWSEYFTRDRSLEKAMFFNQHVPVESVHLFKFVNWSSLLPEVFKKGHVYNSPIHGTSELYKKYPGFLDVRAAPLLADDNKLHILPVTCVITCNHDITRDDGIMYVTRLQKVGVRVTHQHFEDGFHGALFFNGFKIKDKMENHYLNWLNENL